MLLPAFGSLIRFFLVTVVALIVLLPSDGWFLVMLLLMTRLR